MPRLLVLWLCGNGVMRPMRLLLRGGADMLCGSLVVMTAATAEASIGKMGSPLAEVGVGKKGVPLGGS